MRRTNLGDFSCSVARTLEAVGGWWTLLILRDVFLGVTQFDDIQRDLGIARNVLADRLEALVGKGVLERSAYQQRPVRHAYVLTEKGRDLQSVLLAIMAWGDRWEGGAAGPPVALRHAWCGRGMTPVLVCSGCGLPLHGEEIFAEAGPGSRAAPGTAVVGELLAAGRRRLGPD